MGKYALLIGVSEYQDGLKPLPAAEKDVEALLEVLQDTHLGGFDEVIVLKNPTLNEMQEEVETLFDNRNRDDLLMLYFSGHGITDEQGRFFFTTRNTRKSPHGRLRKSTAVSANFVHDILENSESDRQVVILDCCHSGAFPEGFTTRDAGVISLKQQLGGVGRAVLTSSAATQYSFERQGEDLAVYTRYLVEGIKTGAADRNRDGWISIDELHDYVKDQVRIAAPAMKPERYISREGEKIILAKAAISEGERQFREEVERRIRKGKLSPTVRRTLNAIREELRLPTEQAEAIIQDVLRPHEEYQRRLANYREAFREAVQYEYPISDETRMELMDLQQVLSLRLEDTQPIEIAAIESLATFSHPAIEKPKPPRDQYSQERKGG